MGKVGGAGERRGVGQGCESGVVSSVVGSGGVLLGLGEVSDDYPVNCVVRMVVGWGGVGGIARVVCGMGVRGDVKR